MTKPAVGSTSRDSLWPTLREEVRDSRHSSWDWWLWVWVRGVDQALEDKLLATWLHLCHVFQSQCCVDTAAGASAARPRLHHCRHLDHDWLLHYLNVHNGLVYRNKLLLDAHHHNVLEVGGELLPLLYNNGLLVNRFPSSPHPPEGSCHRTLLGQRSGCETRWAHQSREIGSAGVPTSKKRGERSPWHNRHYAIQQSDLQGWRLRRLTGGTRRLLTSLTGGMARRYPTRTTTPSQEVHHTTSPSETLSSHLSSPFLRYLCAKIWLLASKSIFLFRSKSRGLGALVQMFYPNVFVLSYYFSGMLLL